MEKWVVVLLLLAPMELAPAEVIRRYVGVGGELKVEPPEISEPISGVLWKHNMNLLAEWIKDSLNLTYYGGFKGRTTLDTTTGHLQVLNMCLEDAGLYRVEINNKIQDLRYNIIVIKEVREPAVVVRPVICSPSMEQCTLSCEGKTAGSEPVSYSWRRDDGPWSEKSEKKDLDITKTETEKVKSFSCRMENPVSHRDSKSEDNPFFVDYVLISCAVLGPVGGVIIIIIVVFFVHWIRVRKCLEGMTSENLKFLSKKGLEYLRMAEYCYVDEEKRLRRQECLRKLEDLHSRRCLSWKVLKCLRRLEQLRRSRSQGCSRSQRRCRRNSEKLLETSTDSIKDF